MAKSPELDHVVGLIRTRAASARQTLDEDRLSYETMTAALKMEDNIQTERIGAGGVAAEWISAPGGYDNRVILYFHGGGYVVGSMRTHRVMLSHIAKASGFKVLGLDYRLAPEFPFPAPIEDALAAYRWLLASGYKPNNIVLGGDSAGGGLVPAAMVAMRYLGDPMPAAGVCISPWIDMDATSDTFVTNAELDPSVSRERIHNIAKAYLGGKDSKSPLAAPLYADLSGLAPLFIQVGGIETLLGDAQALEKRAKAAGVQAELEVWDDMPHVWHHFAPILPEGQRAIAGIADFINKQVV